MPNCHYRADKKSIFYALLNSHNSQGARTYCTRNADAKRNQAKLNQIQYILKQNEDDPKYRVLFDQYREWAFDVLGDVTKPERPE